MSIFYYFFSGAGGSDFLSSEILASSEQNSFFLVFFRMCFSGSRHLYIFVSSESGITLLLLNWESSFNYFMVTERDLFRACYKKNKFMKLIEYFRFRLDILTANNFLYD